MRQRRKYFRLKMESYEKQTFELGVLIQYLQTNGFQQT